MSVAPTAIHHLPVSQPPADVVQIGPVYPTKPPKVTYADGLTIYDKPGTVVARPLANELLRKAAERRRLVDWDSSKTQYLVDKSTGTYSVRMEASTRPLPGRYDVMKTPAGKWAVLDHKGEEMAAVRTWRYALRLARHLATEYAEQLRDTKHAELFGACSRGGSPSGFAS